jgi:hypothetical protein
LSFWRLISTSPQNQESYIPRLSRDGPTKVVVAKKQFDDKAANFWPLSRPTMTLEEENFLLR